MKVYKVVREVRGKLYSSVVERQDGGLLYTPGLSVSGPRGREWVFVFKRLCDAVAFAFTNEKMQVWRAEGQQVRAQEHRGRCWSGRRWFKRFWREGSDLNFRTPKGTYSCVDLVLEKRVA